MANPWRRPKTGRYDLREWVSLDLADRVKGRRVMLPVGGQVRQVTLGQLVKVSRGTREDKLAGQP